MYILAVNIYTMTKDINLQCVTSRLVNYLRETIGLKTVMNAIMYIEQINTCITENNVVHFRIQQL